jgi:pimeloyl-ACP methyl ester carboxylesterase
MRRKWTVQRPEEYRGDRDSAALVVLVHGLNGCPADLELQATRFADLKCKVYTPTVPNGGNGSLAQSADTILARVLEHVDAKGRAASIALVGLSNGGRIAAWIEVCLRRLRPRTPVILSTLATPFEGTVVLNVFGNAAVALGLYNRRIVADLKRESVASHELLAALRGPGCPGPRAYEFYAAEYDGLVRPVQSALPRIGKGERLVHVAGHCHSSIALHVVDDQTERCMAFLQRHARDPK